MSEPLVTCDATLGELRNNPKAFEERNDYVASIVWEKQVGENVCPGDMLAYIQWGHGSTNEPLNAPDGCTGKVRYLNRNIVYEDLEYAPSQLLAQIS